LEIFDTIVDVLRDGKGLESSDKNSGDAKSKLMPCSSGKDPTRIRVKKQSDLTL
jgi:hypothetical protein